MPNHAQAVGGDMTAAAAAAVAVAVAALSVPRHPSHNAQAVDTSVSFTLASGVMALIAVLYLRSMAPLITDTSWAVSLPPRPAQVHQEQC
jgi:hypothetical protein